ncbi:hypothetical protein [Pseudomonas aeruginosa]|uniref:hypothetical protein n=1 Tax=Pseudomonas aeruginosa TaxID=287 RepID=UPI00320C258F
MAGLQQLNWASEGVGATAAALVDLSTVAGNKISNPPWVKFQSAGWVNFPSAPTAEVFEWVVKDEEIELVWSGLEGTYSDGQIKRFGHINRLGSLQDVYRNNVKTYSDLRQKAPLL